MNVDITGLDLWIGPIGAFEWSMGFVGGGLGAGTLYNVETNKACDINFKIKKAGIDVSVCWSFQVACVINGTRCGKDLVVINFAMGMSVSGDPVN